MCEALFIFGLCGLSAVPLPPASEDNREVTVHHTKQRLWNEQRIRNRCFLNTSIIRREWTLDGFPLNLCCTLRLEHLHE